MPKPFLKEFRDDVIRVAENRDPEVTLAQIAKEFGVHVCTPDKWMRQARIEAGEQPGETKSESVELRELRERNRLLEQENEVLRRAAAYLPQAHLPAK
ncbi:transposase [Leucobacter weissii]|uniref:transposase n=1 Tax=Leucobacter weissii TaxID=1983706 RepID=UPI003C7B1CE0